MTNIKENLYYIVEHSKDTAIVGSDYPQAYNFIKGYNPRKENGLFSLYKYRTTFPDFIPDLDGIKLSGRAKLTDFVSTPFGAWIISPKAKDVLEKYKLCPHRFYPMSLYVRNKIHEYFFFLIKSDLSDSVDYLKSTFVEYDLHTSTKLQPTLIRSKKMLLDIKEKVKEERGVGRTIWADSIVMSNEFNKGLDFFVISIIDANTYISKKLMTDITDLGLTGWEFMPANNLQVE